MASAVLARKAKSPKSVKGVEGLAARNHTSNSCEKRDCRPEKRLVPRSSTFAAVGRAGPLVAPNRGARRAARSRASRHAVGEFARRRREPRARVVSTSSAPRGADRRAAPRHRDASLQVDVGRDALSSATEETQRRAVRAKQTGAQWMSHLVPRCPVSRAPLHHLQLVLDQPKLLRTGRRAFTRAGRG